MTQVIVTPPPVPPPIDPGSDAPPTLTVTYYRQLAAHIMAALDEMTAIIPRLQATVQRTTVDVKPPSGHHNIPVPFLITAVDSVEQIPALLGLGKLDVSRGRDTLQLIEAFRSIQDRANAFGRDLGHVLDARQSALALQALDAYAIAQSLDRDKSDPALTACVLNMKRDLGRRGPVKKNPDSDPDQVPGSANAAPQTAEEGEGKDTEPRGHAARA